MKIITNYALREFTKLFCFCLAAFIAIFLTVDFFEKVDRFAVAKVSTVTMIYFFLLKIPQILVLMIPVAVLMGIMLCLGILYRNNEITAMKSCGISMNQLAYPFLLVCLLCSLLSFSIDQKIVPHASEVVNRIWELQIEKKPAESFYLNEKIWFRGSNSIYNIQVYQKDKKVFEGVTIYFLDKDFNLVKRLDAKRAQWVDGKWLFHNGLTQIKDPDGSFRTTRFSVELIDLPEKPSDLEHVIKNSEEMTVAEISNYINKIKTEGYNATRYEVDLHAKIAFPLVSVILGLIGISVALGKGNKGGLAGGIGISIAFSFFYWVFFGFSVSMGYSGLLPPFLSAWLANITFGLFGAYLFMNIPQ
ncbi:MAG: LPS export ABC transporter permease LptG [Deltaproteobacteria bacterium]|nr:LPS export ABC transporter permease LptG [Deltaproteobacteria bacterium]